MTATQTPNATVETPKQQVRQLYVAFELGWSKWGLGFTTGFGQKARKVTIQARDLPGVEKAIKKALDRFKLPTGTPVRSCYEAGRDGFWLDRWLKHKGIENLIVDSSSIELKRRAKRTKTDRLDLEKLVQMLIRFHLGDEKVWSVVRPPTVEEEERRQLHRELVTLKSDRTSHVNRIKGLLAGCGLKCSKVADDFPQRLQALRTWDDHAFVDQNPELHQRLLREYERFQFVDQQIRELQKGRAKQIRDGEGKQIEMVRQLLSLRGIGENGAWLSTMEVFSWREIANRRQLGSLIGLTPAAHQSGDSTRDQGISKAGSRWMRALAIELAWCWVRFQPGSELTKWYQRRFAEGSKRIRKIGIVALARKLMIKLWQYLETGVVPDGAQVVDWRTKMGRRALKPMPA